MLWQMMERVDTRPPYGSITMEVPVPLPCSQEPFQSRAWCHSLCFALLLKEWISFNMTPDHFQILSSEEWDKRLKDLFPTQQASPPWMRARCRKIFLLTASLCRNWNRSSLTTAKASPLT